MTLTVDEIIELLWLCEASAPEAHEGDRFCAKCDIAFLAMELDEYFGERDGKDV